MLFTITTWIIVLTVAGIIAVCVFRAICEPEVDLEKKYGTRAKRASETNHYEPLNHELKKIEAEAEAAKTPDTAEKEEPKEPVKEAVLVDVKTEDNKVEPVIPEEKKPLNTQTAENPEALQEVVTTTAVVEVSNTTPAVKTVVIETHNQQSSQTLVSSSVSTVSAVNVQKSAEILPSQPPIVKINDVTATVADPIVEPPVAPSKTPPAPTNPPPIDLVAPEQPSNNEIPTPYNEVEGATLPRLNGPTEITAAVKVGVLPS